jgi:hypothetical protein
LWGDVPALMPIVLKASKVPGFRFDGSGKSFQSASVEHTGVKAPGMNWSDQTRRGQDFTRHAGNHAIKNSGGSWFNVAHNIRATATWSRVATAAWCICSSRACGVGGLR